MCNALIVEKKLKRMITKNFTYYTAIVVEYYKKRGC